MPFDGTPRPRPSNEEISFAYESLVRLEEFFDGGRNWHRGELRDGLGSFCLIGAVDRLRCDDLTLRYLVRVARTRHERCPFGQPVINKRSLRRLRGTPQLSWRGSGAGDRRLAAIDAFACVTGIRPLPCLHPADLP